MADPQLQVIPLASSEEDPEIQELMASGDVPQNYYTILTVDVVESIGAVDSDQVEIAMLSRIGNERLRVGEPPPAPGEDAIWFVTRVAPEFGFSGFVRTNTHSIVTAATIAHASGEVAAADPEPARDSPESREHSGSTDHVESLELKRDLARLGNMDAVMASLRSSG